MTLVINASAFLQHASVLSLRQCVSSHIVASALPRRGRRVAGRLPGAALTGTVTAEERPPDDAEAGRTPSHVQRTPKLVPGVGGSERIVEVLCYSVSVPRGSHQSQETCDNEDHSSSQSHLVFLLRRVCHTCGAPHPHHGNQHRNEREEHRSQHQPPGALDDPWQLQQRVVDLTLDLACALRCTRLPQPLVQRLSSDNVVPGVGRSFPLHHHCGRDGPDETQEGQAEAQQLDACVGHNCSQQ